MPRPLSPVALAWIAHRVQDGWTFARVDGDPVSLPGLAARMNARGWDYDEPAPYGGREAVTGRVLDDGDLAEVIALVRLRLDPTDGPAVTRANAGRSGAWRRSFAPEDEAWLRARFLESV